MKLPSTQDISSAAYRKLIATALAAIESHARRPGVQLSTFTAATDWFRLKLADYEHEVFAAAWLDNRNRLIAFEELFRGTLSATSVPVREVVKAALRHNAGAVLFAHNHPSGCATASGEDIVLTLELGRALDLVDVRVLDHFVITTSEPPRSVWIGVPPSMRTVILPQRAGGKRAKPGAKKHVGGDRSHTAIPRSV
ncbi:JAB domain-containing protein [Tahibacter caeni]|uniref:JAB domain-containing protein n=1 Tax=Tahibacter caeni TaxID=1453545 RepID=UPI002147C9C1|nr:JAB domain-containing protein [Tahibacter caeni]